MPYFLIGLLVFVTSMAIGADAPADVHVQDIFPAVAFFASVVVAVLAFLLKFFITRDRVSIDMKFSEMEREWENRFKDSNTAMGREITILHKHMEHMEAKTKSYVDGVGIKLERLSETIDAKVGEEVEELKRHDSDLYNKFNQINHDLGRLKGEHDTLKDQHHKAWRTNSHETP